MSNITSVDTVEFNALYFRAKGSVTPITLPGDGVLAVDLAAANCYTLATDQTLRGIRLVDSSAGGAIVSDFQLADPSNDPNITREPMIMIRAEPGGTVTLSHEDETVSDLTERIYVSSGTAALIGENRVQVFLAKTSGAWRAEIPDWNRVAAQIAYTPGNGADWTDPDPTTIAEALDRLAAALTPVP